MSTQHPVVLAAGAASGLHFRTSSFCGDMNCVGIAATPSGDILVRNTKDNENGPVLRFTPGEWHDFLRGVAADEFIPDAR
ncbi:MAG: DUF397 domain-containing protein [Pseudonocardiaceae bacterium]